MSKCKHFPIFVRRWGCAVRTKLYTAQPRGVRECVLHLCIPLMCTGKWGRTGMLHRRLTCGPSHPQIKCDDAFILRFCLEQSFCFLVYRVLVDVHKFQSRCNILTCTIFHYPHVQIYTPVHPWVVHYMLNYVLNNSRGVHRQVFHLCMPPYVYWKIEVYQNVTPG